MDFFKKLADPNILNDEDALLEVIDKASIMDKPYDPNRHIEKAFALLGLHNRFTQFSPEIIKLLGWEASLIISQIANENKDPKSPIQDTEKLDELVSSSIIQLRLCGKIGQEKLDEILSAALLLHMSHTSDPQKGFETNLPKSFSQATTKEMKRAIAALEIEL